MPITAAAAALIGSGINTAGQIGSGIMQGVQNRANRKFTEKMYNRQRSDALTDRDFENSYNSPAAQMKRLKEAGLNPNLVYDNGGAAAASANARGATSTSADTSAPKIDTSGIADSMFKYFDILQTQAQTNLTQAQAHTQEEQQNLMRAQTAGAYTNIDKTNQDMDISAGDFAQRQRLADTQYESARVGLSKSKADLAYTINQDVRAAAHNAASIAEIAERILKSQSDRSKAPAEKAHILAQIKHLQEDTRLKKLDADLKAKGIQPHDGAVLRLIQNVLTGGGTMDEAIEKVKEFNDKSLLDKLASFGPGNF